MIQFDKHIFQMGWFNHQLDKGPRSLKQKCQLTQLDAGESLFSIFSPGSTWIHLVAAQGGLVPLGGGRFALHKRYIESRYGWRGHEMLYTCIVNFCVGLRFDCFRVYVFGWLDLLFDKRLI